MYSKYGIVFSFLLFIFFSCSQKEQFPAKFAEKVAVDNVVLNHSFLSEDKVTFNDSVQKMDYGKELDELLLQRKYYNEQNATFNLADLENLWSNLKIQRSNFNVESLTQWIEITGFLLELTGNGIYASELEETVYQSSATFTETEFREIEKHVIPWIFTKNVDHIHVNLFVNSTIKYEHTLKGAVEITQECNYPGSGKIQLKFKMQNKRYIEVFIHIPEWAEGATVIEKGVKYVAQPGSYSQVVRKWSDGDFIEINLPIEQMPKR